MRKTGYLFDRFVRLGNERSMTRCKNKNRRPKMYSLSGESEMSKLLIAAFLFVGAFADEGRQCRHVSKDRAGTCLSPSACPSAFLDEELQYCPTDGGTDLVCCSPDEAGVVSAAKCLEYSKLDLGKCGIRSERTDRLEAYGREFPSIALVSPFSRSTFGATCNGVLISERFVLTEGFCIIDGNAKMQVRLGDLNLTTEADDARPQTYKVEKVYPFPGINESVYYHDIGLLKLDRDVKFTAYVKPSCLHVGADVKVKDEAVNCGYGLVGDTGRMSKVLRRKNVYINNVEDCRTEFRVQRPLPQGLVGETQMCVGSEETECVSLGGSPLLVVGRNVKCMYSVLGLLSLGRRDCGEEEASPKIYTRIEPYLPWIESVVWPKGPE